MVFEKQMEDPYLRRYGREPGEGWIPLPETRTEIRFNGFVQVDYIHDFQDAGFAYNWFVPAQIAAPTEGTSNTEFDARSSRLAFETRTNTEEVGAVSTMFEFDFFGEPLREGSVSPRLRQAYVTWVGPRSHVAFTAGQAWTTFIDLEVWPAILDMQGPNAMTGVRQGLLRGSYASGEGRELVFDLALEQPSTAVQGGAGLKDLPDLSARVKRGADWGHLQFAALARQLKAESDAGLGHDFDFGYGLLLSGQFQIPGTERTPSPDDQRGPLHDAFKVQLVGGEGLGRYINDPASNAVPGDAVYDPVTGSLEVIPVFGYFAAYEHYWTDNVHTALVYGFVDVDNRDQEGAGALDRSRYVLANLGVRLFSRMYAGLEYTWGERLTKSGQTGHANRVQIGLNYGF